MNVRKIAMMIGMGTAGLCLVGAGAGATFSDSVHATQRITAGTLNMTVQGPDGSSTDGKTVTFADTAPEQSTFTTGPQLVTTTNSGNITAQALRLSATDVSNNAALHDSLYVEIDSFAAPNGTGTPVVVYNGLLSALESSPISIQGPIAPNQTDPFYVTYYAGNNGANSDGATGNNLDNAPSLENAAEGGVVIPKITVEYTG